MNKLILAIVLTMILIASAAHATNIRTELNFVIEKMHIVGHMPRFDFRVYVPGISKPGEGFVAGIFMNNPNHTFMHMIQAISVFGFSAAEVAASTPGGVFHDFIDGDLGGELSANTGFQVGIGTLSGWIDDDGGAWINLSVTFNDHASMMAMITEHIPLSISMEIEPIPADELEAICEEHMIEQAEAAAAAQIPPPPDSGEPDGGSSASTVPIDLPHGETLDAAIFSPANGLNKVELSGPGDDPDDDMVGFDEFLCTDITGLSLQPAGIASKMTIMAAVCDVESLPVSRPSAHGFLHLTSGNKYFCQNSSPASIYGKSQSVSQLWPKLSNRTIESHHPALHSGGSFKALFDSFVSGGAFAASTSKGHASSDYQISQLWIGPGYKSIWAAYDGDNVWFYAETGNGTFCLLDHVAGVTGFEVDPWYRNMFKIWVECDRLVFVGSEGIIYFWGSDTDCGGF